MRYKQCAVLTLVITLLLAGTIYGCRNPLTEPRPTPTELPPTPTDERLDEIRAECEAPSNAGIKKLAEHPELAGLLYREGQVIVTGAPAMVEQVARIVGLEELINSFDLDEQTAVHLYNTDKTVQQVTCEINKLEAFYGVFADPNYHLSPAQWIGGGSPWTQNGGWIGNPHGGGQGNATADAFQEQWAFGPEGIHLFEDDRTHWGKQMGEGTRIAIFDTSPFTATEEWGGGNRCDDCSIQQLMEGAPAFSGMTMTLTVWHQIDLIEAPGCPGYDRHDKEKRSLEGQDISNHGLFVAGLAHAVAPSSEVYLVRVLEDDGCGTLYQIAEGIRVFMDEILDQEGNLRGTVINLSLGVHKPAPEFDFGLPGDIRMLEGLLREAVDQGAIVVAAAGNDSYDWDPKKGGNPRSMELPAGYSFVVGVAASSKTRMRGCFSNADTTADPSNVAAPGGDGLYLNGEERCTIPDCMNDDTLCLISLVRRPTPGYAYWVGTSFAAPLVSGQKALLLEHGGGIPPGDTLCPSPDPTLPNGIINWAKVSGSACPP
jgi:hypothetical protein